MTPPTYRSEGNIKYGVKDSEALVEEIYHRLKGIEVISETIPHDTHDPRKDTNDNIRNIEKKIDDYINSHQEVQKMIVDIYEKKDIIIPYEGATEKNESIDAIKRIIKDTLGIK